ncbi:MAG: hypothetical protein AAF804_09300, partial [Bacteroidota bacterium]
MNHLLWLLWILIGLACSHTPQISSEIDQLKTSIRARYQSGDTALMRDAELAAFWPVAPDGWSGTPAKSKSYDHAQRPFKIAEKSYHQGGDVFLGISLGDYAQDSSALMFLRKEWPAVSYLKHLPGKK